MDGHACTMTTAQLIRIFSQKYFKLVDKHKTSGIKTVMVRLFGTIKTS